MFTMLSSFYKTQATAKPYFFRVNNSDVLHINTTLKFNNLNKESANKNNRTKLIHVINRQSYTVFFIRKKCKK
jgi:hypothetical protein